MTGWTSEARFIRNDVDEFAAVFAQGSKDTEALSDAANPTYVGDEDDWDDWWIDYGNDLAKALEIVEHRLKAGQSELPPGGTDEVVIEADTPHSAYVKIRDIVEQASIRLTIVDPWVSSDLFPLLTNVDPKANVRILTKKDFMPKDFGTEAEKFARQHSMSLEVRTGLHDWHDRFIVVDDRVFHSGASFKDIGKKVSYVAEISSVNLTVIDEIEKRWKTATPV
ncbi:MAG: hypothetical protein IH957_06005 [Chloroflexi bacterium]|nr:hypothetical protein [Chloroflexota bacterium]